MPSKKSASSNKRSRRASAQQSLLEGNDDEVASTDFSDIEDKEIDSMEYLFVLQQIREEAHNAAQANFKRQFAAFAAEARGHAAVMVEEMNAYIDKLEMDAVNMRSAEYTGVQVSVNAAREWSTQCSMVNEARAIDLSDIRREEEVNEVSKLIECTATKCAQAHRRLLRKVKRDLEVMRKQEQVITDAKGLVKEYKKLFRHPHRQ
ncbi:hypothetical protein B0F90DRAFT_1688921 [Multifurca ochricompacta]|uniref:Uncharacterized protein n=1 Tax=Multifurca ochricompacta TaxID=376703 RepID=A0AAD4MC08_9AGAM|nr:hypothetical protein B0F90DRAFT_1688921 [Multifurca ochricompacta]